MLKNQQDSLFTELTDAESATVSGAALTSGLGDFKINSDRSNTSEDGVNTLLFVPPPNQLFLYDPMRQRTYKTIVV